MRAVGKAPTRLRKVGEERPTSGAERGGGGGGVLNLEGGGPGRGLETKRRGGSGLASAGPNGGYLLDSCGSVGGELGARAPPGSRAWGSRRGGGGGGGGRGRLSGGCL